MGRWLFACALVVVVSTSGCRSKSNPVAKGKAVKTTTSKTSKTNADQPSTPTGKTPAVSPERVTSPKPPTVPPAPPAPTQDEIDARRTAQLAALDWLALQRETPPLESARYSTSRFLLMAPDGPLIVELQMTIDGEPFDLPMQRLVEQALRLADSDGDGTPTWKELLANTRFRAGQYGNVPIEDGQDESFLRMYDADLDGVADAAELPRVLTRNAGRAKPFFLRSSNYYLENNRINSPVRRLLDRNRDGGIDAAEAKNAARLLRSKDLNEDEILTIEELMSDRQGDPVPLLGRRLSNNPDGAISIAPGDVGNWSRVLYGICERYEAGYPLLPDSFRSPANLFATLDQDGDQKISFAEIAALGEMPPHIRVRLNFGQRGDHELVERVWLCPELEDLGATIAKHPQRIVVQLPSAKIEFFANDAISNNVRQRAMAQLAQLDANQDGYIEKDETPEDNPLSGSFDEYDTNNDGKLFVEELIGAYELEASATAGQIRSRIGFFSDALFAALDVDHNGRLTSRELDSFEQHLAKLDIDENGEVGVNEIPDSMLVGFVRGNPQEDETQLQPPRMQTAGSNENAPRWFRSMDRNQDNEITRAEFLGDSQQFEQLDQNRDNYIDASEAIRESSQ